MGRDLRYLPKSGALVEITQRTFQGRPLLKPSKRLRSLVVGCVAKAQLNTGAALHGLVFLSTHFHLLCSFESVEQMAAFMGQLKTSLSIEIGHLHRWRGGIWGHRYHCVPVSEEPGAQIARLRYLLEHGCKENLVMSPLDWPGAQGADSLCTGRPLAGVWIDRTAFHRAKASDPSVKLEQFERSLDINFEALPCWSRDPEEVWRRRVDELIRDIEEETARRHHRLQTKPLGAAAVAAVDPHDHPRSLKTSPRPRFHAAAKAVRRALLQAYREFLAAYRIAAEQLAEGDLNARFPGNCFPPRLAFVPPSPPEPG
ncbi:MAG: hypothetical protein AAF368_12505 [Planctomycetota bacterium]